MVYDKEPKLCVVMHLTKYLKRTQAFQKTNNLFLTCIKPHKAATKDTVPSWCCKSLFVIYFDNNPDGMAISYHKIKSTVRLAVKSSM